MQVRLPAKLVEMLDKLADEGYYSNRTEAIADAVRRLVEKYSGGGRIAKVVRLYQLGIKAKPVSIEVNPQEVRKALSDRFGTDNVDEIMAIIRRRSR